MSEKTKEIKNLCEDPPPLSHKIMYDDWLKSFDPLGPTTSVLDEDKSITEKQQGDKSNVE